MHSGGNSLIPRNSAAVVFVIVATCVGAACARQESPPTPSLNTKPDKTFTNDTISLRYPDGWTASVQERGVTLRKGDFAVSAEGATALQASGVEGGRLHEYLQSSVVDVACLWSEGGTQALNASSDATKLQNGMTITDYYLDTAQFSPAFKQCLRAGVPLSASPALVYLGSSSGIMGDIGAQTLMQFFTNVQAMVYRKGDAALVSALQEMRGIAASFKPASR
jgi:hypothetical protein